MFYESAQGKTEGLGDWGVKGKAVGRRQNRNAADNNDETKNCPNGHAPKEETKQREHGQYKRRGYCSRCWNHSDG